MGFLCLFLVFLPIILIWWVAPPPSVFSFPSGLVFRLLFGLVRPKVLVSGVSPPPFTDLLPPYRFNFLAVCRLVIFSGGMGLGWLCRVGGVWFPFIPSGLVTSLGPPYWFGFTITGFVWSRGSWGSRGRRLFFTGALGIGRLHGFGWIWV